MSDERKELPVSDEAVEAAMGVVLREVARPSAETWDDTIRAAIQAFLAAEGFEVEERIQTEYPESERRKAQGGRVDVHPKAYERCLVSPWRPA